MLWSKRKHKSHSRYREDAKSIRYVGVYGLHPSSGATHLSILMSWFLSEYAGNRVAYVDITDRCSVGILKQYYHVKQKEEDQRQFCYRGITFYEQTPKFDQEFEDSYDYCVLDFGCRMEKLKSIQCSGMFAVGMASPLKRHVWSSYQDSFAEVQPTQRVQAIFNLYSNCIKPIELSTKGYVLGFEPCLFHPRKENVKLLEEMLSSVMNL